MHTVSRFIVLPLVILIALVTALALWVKWVWAFMLHGGEFIAYTKKTTRPTIQDVFNKLVENQENKK